MAADGKQATTAAGGGANPPQLLVSAASLASLSLGSLPTAAAQQFEQSYVHAVYDTIADHFSHTRHTVCRSERSFREIES